MRIAEERKFGVVYQYEHGELPLVAGEEIVRYGGMEM
jgi:hypothetical protein